ncbi:MAG: plasmid pRiA4b ORF-3 family protein [Cyanobacteria bacterium Co-bin13]|nr:plasmid pRiA4b ORF-3 family protein [Cyanobacteria bacterium Co-bin13]
MNSNSAETFYQLYVELVDSYPPIWRCFQVPARLTLEQLHTVLQVIMGWQNQSPHFFKVNGQRYGQVSIGDAVGDERAIALTEIFSSDPQPCFYTYDPAEGWLHRLELNQVLEPSEQATLSCLDGERACPPEKSGGVWGYEEFLERLNDPDDPEYDALWEQAGASFDPERFDLKGVNQRLTEWLA